MGGVIVVFICVFGALIWGLRAGRKKPDAMSDLADELGLNFRRERDYRLPDEFSCLLTYRADSNRYAHHVFSGVYNGLEIVVFNFHHETTLSDSSDDRINEPHDRAFFVGVLSGAAEQSSVPEIADAEVQLDGNQLALSLDRPLSIEEIKTRLDQLIEISERMSVS